MLYPLKFKPIYKDYIWGGRNLSRYRNNLPDGKIAESWDLSCHPDGISIVSEGELEGISLAELLKIFKNKLIGTSFPESCITNFPLLVKMIDANDKLSVQVHPHDEYAIVFEDMAQGKNEMWYVIDAKPGSKLVCGLKPGTTRQTFLNAINMNDLESCLRYLEVEPGDIINIPAGVIHAIGEGILIAEIQQNSNSTYRLYDYDRIDKTGKKRPLQIEQALNVINFCESGRKDKTAGLKIKQGNDLEVTYAVANRFFAAEIYDLNGKFIEETDGTKFFIYVFLAGKGEIKYQDGVIGINAGDTILIPACLSSYMLHGKFKAIKAYIPNLHNDIVSKLKKAGFCSESIYSIISGL